MAVVYQVTLGDGISGPALQAALALGGLETALVKLKGSTTSASAPAKAIADDFGAMYASATKATAAFTKAATAYDKAFGASRKSQSLRTAAAASGSSADVFLAQKNTGSFDGGGASAVATSLQQKVGQLLSKGLGAELGGVMQVAEMAETALPVVGALASGLQKVIGVAVDVASVLAKVGLAVAGVATAVALSVGKMVFDAAQLKNDTMTAFTAILKSPEAAQAAYDRAAKTSLQIGAGFKETLQSFNTLMAQGFKVNMVDDIVKAMADLKTLNPQANLESITRAIGKIQATGHLQGDELNELVEAGLGAGPVYEALAKRLGKTTAEIQKMQAAGKLQSTDVIPAILDAIKKQTGKEFGGLAQEKADKSLGGTIERLMNMKDQMLAAVNVDWSPATKAIKRVMAVMNSDAGKKLIAAIGDGMSKVIGLLDNLTTADIEKVFQLAADAAGGFADSVVQAYQGGVWLVGVLQSAWVSLKAFGSDPAMQKLASDALAFGAALLGATVAGIQGLAWLNSMTDLSGQAALFLSAAWSTAGSIMLSFLGPIAGIVQSLIALWNAVGDAITNAAGKLKDFASSMSSLGGSVSGGMGGGISGLGGSMGDQLQGMFSGADLGSSIGSSIRVPPPSTEAVSAEPYKAAINVRQVASGDSGGGKGGNTYNIGPVTVQDGGGFLGMLQDLAESHA